MAKKAHTSDGQARPNSVENVAAKELRQFIERIERLEDEKATVASDIKDVYGEAKGRGYDVKAIRKIIGDRKKDREEVMEFEAIVDTYKAALGMLTTADVEAEDGESDLV